MSERRHGDLHDVPDPSILLEATIAKLRDTLAVAVARSGALREELADLREQLETCCHELDELREQIPRNERTHARELAVGRDVNARLQEENRVLREADETAAPSGGLIR